MSRQQVEEVLNSFRGILNRLCVSYLHSEVRYEIFLTHEDANTLVHHLAVAVRFEERQRERLKKARCYRRDLEPPPEA